MTAPLVGMGSFNAIEGTAKDDGSGVAEVRLALKATSLNKSWDGAGFTLAKADFKPAVYTP